MLESNYKIRGGSMYIGIKYELKRKEVNKQLQSLGSAVMFHGQTSYYFTNPIVAFRVKQYLNKKNTSFNYELQRLSHLDIENKKLIKSYNDFINYADSKNNKNSSCTYTDLEQDELGE